MLWILTLKIFNLQDFADWKQTNKRTEQLWPSLWKETRFRWTQSVLSLNSNQDSRLYTLLGGFTCTLAGRISQLAACCELQAESIQPNKAQLVFQQDVCVFWENISVCRLCWLSACRVTEGLRWLTGADKPHRQGGESLHRLFQQSSRLYLQISQKYLRRQIR